MRRLALLALLIIPLLAAAPAAAKEVQAVTACGAGDCATSKNDGLLAAMMDVGPPTATPREPAPFYRLSIAVGDRGETFGRYRSWWVPSANKMLGEDGTWIAVRPEVRVALEHVTRGLAALPAAQLPGFPAAAELPAAPPAQPASSSGDDVPVVPLVIAAALLALVGLVVARYVLRSGPSDATTPTTM
jgi:hypothetical protein